MLQYLSTIKNKKGMWQVIFIPCRPLPVEGCGCHGNKYWWIQLSIQNRKVAQWKLWSSEETLPSDEVQILVCPTWESATFDLEPTWTQFKQQSYITPFKTCTYLGDKIRNIYRSMKTMQLNASDWYLSWRSSRHSCIIPLLCRQLVFWHAPLRVCAHTFNTGTQFGMLAFRNRICPWSQL